MLLAILGLLTVLSAALAQDYGEDPVLEYYCLRSGKALAQSYAFAPGHYFSFKATAYLADLSSKGEVEKVDSAVWLFYVSDGKVDSSHTVVEGPGRLEDWDFSFPNVFEQPYFFNFYPNDTGGAELAIGFDADSTESDLPTGLAQVDRESGQLKELYLHYPHRGDYRNFSLSYRMVEVDSLVMADSIVELGARMGILMPEYYRKTTLLSDIRVIR